MRSANLQFMLSTATAVRDGRCAVKLASVRDEDIRERVLESAPEGMGWDAYAQDALVTIDPARAPISCIVADCAPNVALLEAALAEAGYTVAYTAGNHTVECRVTREGDALLVAFGLSSDRGDALLHAMLGAVREFR